MSDATASGSRPRPLTERLQARIGEQGPLTFAEFMEAALYDSVEGFYSRPVVGERGHFVTSPHVSPVFGILLARQIEEFWELLDRPTPFAVVEAGAGDGTLARQVLESLSPGIRRSTRYQAVERSASGRKALAAAGIEAFADLSQVPQGSIGCILANELLDNLPFHRVRRGEGGLVELFVGWGEDEFVLVEGPLSSRELAQQAPDVPPGTEWIVSLEALRFLDHARRILARGYVWIVDYALGGQDGSASVHGYRDHRLAPDVLADPGSRDITAGVDFHALWRHATALGMSAWGPFTQREVLLRLGFRGLERNAQTRQREAIGNRRGIEAMRIYSNRTRANLLLAKGGLGDFSVLCLGVGADVPTPMRSLGGFRPGERSRPR